MGNVPQTNPEQDFERWKAKTIDEKLRSWTELTKTVYNHDCGMGVLGAAACLTSGIFGILLLGGLATTLGSRARYSNEQQNKLDHLYEQYCGEIKNESQPLLAASTSNAAGLVNGMMNVFGYSNNSPSSSSSEGLPKGLRILKVIGPYIQPQKIPVWDCDAAVVPQAYKDEMYKLGIFNATETDLIAQKGLSPDHSFITENKKNKYTFCHTNPNLDIRLQRRGRLSFYGQHGLANTVLSPVGKVTGAVVDGAASFFCSTAEQALPAVSSAATNAANSAAAAAAKMKSKK